MIVLLKDKMEFIMKKLLLLSLLGLITVSQVECTFGSNLKLFGKNLTKTVLYGAGTAVTGAVTCGSFLCAQEAGYSNVMANGVQFLGENDMLSWKNFWRLESLASDAKPLMFGISALCGLVTLYCGCKTLKSCYKTLTFKE